MRLPCGRRAFWRADVNREPLQRVYAITFPDAKLLKEYQHRMEEVGGEGFGVEGAVGSRAVVRVCSASTRGEEVGAHGHSTRAHLAAPPFTCPAAGAAAAARSNATPGGHSGSTAAAACARRRHRR